MLEMMNSKKRINGFEYSNIFINDVNLTLDYIEYVLENPIASKRLGDETIKDRLNKPFIPKGYKIFDSQVVYYRLYIKNYIVFYTIENDIMQLRRFLYNKRDFDKIDIMT